MRINNIKALVACEESQAVCIELRKLGVEAYSCDIIECSGGHNEWHIQADVLPLLNGNCEFDTVDGTHHAVTGKWDLIIAFPPCTKTTNAGARHLFAGGALNVPRFYAGMCGKALFEAIRHADCPHIAIENPTPSAVFEYPKETQAIQPYEYGHKATKRTCLWLTGLPPLKPTDIVNRPEYRSFTQRNGNVRNSCWTMDVNADRARQRAKTFPGIAHAMATQWTSYIQNSHRGDTHGE